jgi:hypothetical protein
MRYAAATGSGAVAAAISTRKPGRAAFQRRESDWACAGVSTRAKQSALSSCGAYRRTSNSVTGVPPFEPRFAPPRWERRWVGLAVVSAAWCRVDIAGSSQVSDTIARRASSLQVLVSPTVGLSGPPLYRPKVACPSLTTGAFAAGRRVLAALRPHSLYDPGRIMVLIDPETGTSTRRTQPKREQPRLFRVTGHRPVGREADEHGSLRKDNLWPPPRDA